MTQPVWVPSRERVADANLTRFMRDVGEKSGVPVTDYASLYQFSIDRPSDFWRAVWDFTGIIGERGNRVLENPERMPGARFFPDARLNFAENLLRRRDSQPAILYRDESGRRRTLTWGELHGAVVSFAGGLLNAGVGPGDRVAGFVPNLPESIIGALGSAAIGAVWSSCSPDFGAQGVLDRFGQIEPKVLVSADAYDYAGKRHDCLVRLQEIARSMPSLRRVVVVPHVDSQPAIAEPRPRRRVGRVPGFRIRARRAVRAIPVRSPALHPVLLGHDRGAEVHRPRRRWHADSASQRASAALRHPRR